MWKIAYKCPKCEEFLDNFVCPVHGKIFPMDAVMGSMVHIYHIERGIKNRNFGEIPVYYKDEEGCIWKLKFVLRTHNQRRRFVANRKPFYRKIDCKKENK